MWYLYSQIQDKKFFTGQKSFMRSLFSVICCAFLCVFSGCISYSYDGKETGKTSENVTVFSDSAKIKRPYTVLGRAVVSGSYQHVSRDRMVAKLVDEAKKCGADALLIVEQQVLPDSMVSSSGNGGFFTAYDYDSSSRSWGELYRDVDVVIGNIGQNGAAASGTGSFSDYKRVLRAEFLRYTAKPGNAGKK